ncbi:MAG: class I SAM-dependent methyltransferase [Candidatus Competibacteraceae bacterium]
MIAVTTTVPVLKDRAAALAQDLNLPLLSASDDAQFPWLLVLTLERLELCAQRPAAPGPIYVDFIDGPLAYRRRHGGGRRQPLARAIGLKGGANPTVLDATAGLGRDAFVLACLGCKVRLVERSPIIAVLLRDGMERAAQDPEIGTLVKERLRLTVADSRLLLTDLSEGERPEVVYLDPMYPHRDKAALVKKEMRLLRELVGDDADASDLLAAALHCARRRVVVKRPRLAPALDGPRPTMRISAENTRFDVYLSA